jgi:beta-phosphoglucomutase family hydrolase
VVVLGLPDDIRVLLFDLDGVLTQTAKVHAAAWKKMFDAYLKERADAGGEPFREFTQDDYEKYVDGKPRSDGVRSFLESRSIDLPEGAADDPPDAETVSGLGNRKNDLVLKVMAEDGVEAYPGTVRYLDAVREGGGFRAAVVSSSSNAEQALEAAGIADRFEARVDGKTIAEQGLKGKPAPDTFLEGAKLLGVEPKQAAVFEDALAGVAAGRAGNFGYVVGVNRGDDEQRRGLKENGADIVVDDVSELLG